MSNKPAPLFPPPPKPAPTNQVSQRNASTAPTPKPAPQNQAISLGRGERQGK